MTTVWAKDPAATLEWKFDWSAWLAEGETITDATFTAGELTVVSNYHDDTSATVWLSGGDARTKQRVTCHVETDAGRIDERTITIQIMER